MSDNTQDPAVPAAHISIAELRQQIDSVDTTLLYALAQRMTLVEQIGRCKQAAAIPTIQMDRWRKLLDSRIRQGRGLKLSEHFVVALFELIHQEAIAVQDALPPFAAEERISLP